MNITTMAAVTNIIASSTSANLTRQAMMKQSKSNSLTSPVKYSDPYKNRKPTTNSVQLDSGEMIVFDGQPNWRIVEEENRKYREARELAERKERLGASIVSIMFGFAAFGFIMYCILKVLGVM